MASVVPFNQSPSGRLVALAAACFLAGGAAMLLVGQAPGDHTDLYIIGLSFPVSITIAFIGVGLGLHEYGKELMYTVLMAPPALWGFYYLMGELEFNNAHSWGYGVLLLAVIAAGRAAFPGGADHLGG